MASLHYLIYEIDFLVAPTHSPFLAYKPFFHYVPFRALIFSTDWLRGSFNEIY